MDWLAGMNQVSGYIEENLTEDIGYASLAKLVGCSAYEFSRIFSFMTGMAVSEYIRRRRLSQAVFDIQNGNEKIIDIALKYRYESQAAFSRAFKELHGHTPASARVNGISLKTYPPITFKLIIKGVDEMRFRIERKESFQIMGLKGMETANCEPGASITPLWREFLDRYNPRLCHWRNGCKENYYSAPFWQVAAYCHDRMDSGEVNAIIGAEYKGEPLEGMDMETIPAAIWAVFAFASVTGFEPASEAYTRIHTEWFPASQYKRDEAVPHLEVYPDGDASSNDYEWEIWMPIVNK